MTNDTTALTPPKKRKISLTKSDRQALAQQRQIELAVSLFLDLDQDRTVKQIAEEMGMTVSSLKRMTQSAEFQQTYDETLMQLGHHPRLQALQANLPDLLPLSYAAMRRLLGPGTAHTAQVAAVKLLWETAKVGDNVIEEDPQLLNNFLKQAGVKVEGDLIINANLPIPKDYQAAFQRLMGGDIVDAVATDIDTAAGAAGSDSTASPASPAQSPTPETSASQPPDASG